MVAKYFLRPILILLDGKLRCYMKLYLSYIKFLGLKLEGKPLYICADLKIDSTDYSKISIGDQVVISSEVRILTHDFSVNKAIAYMKKNQKAEIKKVGFVKIEDGAFIGLRTTIMPNVKIGKGAIVGACSVVVKDVPEFTVVAGNPARHICTLKEYSEKVLKDILYNSNSYFTQ